MYILKKFKKYLKGVGNMTKNKIRIVFFDLEHGLKESQTFLDLRAT